MPNRQILAIDPGISGGLAYYSPSPASWVALKKMPATEAKVLALLQAFKRQGLDVVYLEEVGGYNSSKGKQPGSRMFTFGEGFGLLKGICLALEIPMVIVSPQAWQKAIGMPSSGGDYKGHKQRLQAEAVRRHPEMTLSITQAVADALLILDYACDVEGVSVAE